MAFVDEVSIHVESGAGGNGCVSFRREKYIPKGGPDGGNGGRGGSVLLVPTQNKQSLLDFTFRPLFQAERGEHGRGKDQDGHGGENLRIQVPVGTVIFDKETGECLADLVDADQPFEVARGGKGGRGNLSFKSSTNRAPRTSTKGQPGESLDLRLELRLMADIGFVGLPNAGKSSLLRKVSRAHPKVASYPFTTLSPCLGVVSHKGRNLVMADLPGLIEGAGEGVGLGHQFLRHASRNRILLHLIELRADVDEMIDEIRVIEKELHAHDTDLGDRERWLVFTKADLFTEEELKTIQDELKSQGAEGFTISSMNGNGIDALLDKLATKSLEWEVVEEEEGEDLDSEESEE